LLIRDILSAAKNDNLNCHSERSEESPALIRKVSGLQYGIGTARDTINVLRMLANGLVIAHQRWRHLIYMQGNP
jgi:hypothetical protein